MESPVIRANGRPVAGFTFGVNAVSERRALSGYWFVRRPMAGCPAQAPASWNVLGPAVLIKVQLSRHCRRSATGPHRIDQFRLHLSTKAGTQAESLFSWLWSAFRYRLSLNREIQRDDPPSFERSVDASLIFKSVFALTCAIATSSARCWKFAQTGSGASLMTFP